MGGALVAWLLPGAGGSRWVLGLAQLESVRCAVSSGRVGPGSGPRFCRFTQSGLSLRWSKRRRKRKDAAQAPTCTCTCSPRALPTLESRTRVRTTARCQSRAYSGTCDTNRTHISTTTAPHCNFVANTVLSHVLILIYLPTRVLSLALSLPAGVAIVSHPPTTQQVTISRPAVDHSAHTDLPHNLISAPPALHTHSTIRLTSADTTVRLTPGRRNGQGFQCAPPDPPGRARHLPQRALDRHRLSRTPTTNPRWTARNAPRSVDPPFAEANAHPHRLCNARGQGKDRVARRYAPDA